jgi:hypothetical protein
VKSPFGRRELLDAFGKHGRLTSTAAGPETAADGLSRLRRVNKALEAFDKKLRSHVVSLLDT